MSNPRPTIPNEFQRDAERIYKETRRRVQTEDPLREQTTHPSHAHTASSSSNRGGGGQPGPQFIAQSRQNPASSQHGQPARVETMQMQAMGRESTGTLDTLPEDLRPRPRRETKPRTGCCDGCLSGTSTVLKVSGHVANNAGAFGGE